MSLEFDREDLSTGATLITVRGRMLVGPQFRELETAVEELSSGPAKHIIFDLTSVVQIDSTGMGVFISAHGKLQKTGGELRLAGARGAVQDAFHVKGDGLQVGHQLLVISLRQAGQQTVFGPSRRGRSLHCGCLRLSLKGPPMAPTRTGRVSRVSKR